MLALLIVAVAATTVGLGLVVNVQGTDQGVFGNANSRVEIAARARTASPPIWRPSGSASARPRRSSTRACRSPGRSPRWICAPRTRTGRSASPMLRLVSGRYPSGASEAAVTRAVATTFSLKVGSTWSVNGRSLRVVGIVENPKDLQDAFGLVAPGEIASPSSLTLLFNCQRHAAAAPAASCRFRNDPGDHDLGRQLGAGACATRRIAVLLLATIGLTFIGLLSVAGFTVMAQRRLRALGMIGAIGATDRQVRRVMLANGAAVGVVGSVTGAAIGLAVWFALTPAFEKRRRAPLRPVRPSLVGGDRRRDPRGADLDRRLLVAGPRGGAAADRRGAVGPAGAAAARAPLRAARHDPGRRRLHLPDPRPQRAHRADRRRHPGHHRGHAAAGAAGNQARWRRLPVALRSPSAWRCATWPATRRVPARRWLRPASRSASPRPSR